MKSDESPIAWLNQEVNELIEAGSVGLHDFPWLINGAKFDLSQAAKRSLTKAVAGDIISSGKVVLYEVEWPTVKITSGPHGVEKIDETNAFPTQPLQCYLAIFLVD